MGVGRVEGVDPFLSETTTTRHGALLRKGYLDDVPDRFDLVMFHHSLEHVPDPLSELRAAADRLERGGRCLVRIPTPSSEAWDEYGADWVQLDAPRHLTLISRQGMAILANAAGLTIEATEDDSEGWSFLASALYRRGVPLKDQKDRSVWFSPEEIAAAERHAKKVNQDGRGDQTAFVLRRA